MTPQAAAPGLVVLPLGGCGEFGRNATLLVDGELDSGPCVLIDCGARMGDADLPGVDLLLPDLDVIAGLGARLQGYLVTHSHEDHAAALPFALERLAAPIYATRYAQEQLSPRLASRKLDHLPRHTLVPGQRMQVGPFEIEPVAVSHSIPDSLALVVRRGDATLVFSGDFRVDLDPVHGPATDLERLQQIGDEGVALLFSDSTGATEPGDNPGERSIAAALAEVVRSAPARVIIATFTSHVHRIRQILEIAQSSGRRVVLLGRSAQEHVALARRMGVIDAPPGLIVDVAEAMDTAPSQLLVVATGCQGEHRAALPRMARGARDLPPVEPGDRVVFSSRNIPGNAPAVLRTANQLVRRGAEIVWGDTGVHVSGHGHRGDLRQLLERVRPQVFMPAHGDRLHLEAHAALAHELGYAADRVALVDNGQPVELYQQAGQWRYRGGPELELEPYFVEQNRLTRLPSAVVAARHNAARRGMLAVALPVQDPSSGRLGPASLRSGGIDEGAFGELLTETRAEIDRDLAKLSSGGHRDLGQIEEVVVASVRRAFRRRRARAPQVLVLVVPHQG